MGFGDLINKAKTTASDFQADRQQKAADEQARQQSILNGQISPIQVSASLQAGEVAYLQLNANRMAVVETTVEHTKGKTKKKHLLSRKAKVNTTTTHDVEANVRKLDAGPMILTNKRLLFVGDAITDLPYSAILDFRFKHSLTGSNKVAIKYQGMQKGEFFELSGDNAKDAELYYLGITKNLLAL
jgi:hypothetical protein